jgi:hypothetical protein
MQATAQDPQAGQITYMLAHQHNGGVPLGLFRARPAGWVTEPLVPACCEPPTAASPRPSLTHAHTHAHDSFDIFTWRSCGGRTSHGPSWRQSADPHSKGRRTQRPTYLHRTHPPPARRPAVAPPHRGHGRWSPKRQGVVSTGANTPAWAWPSALAVPTCPCSTPGPLGTHLPTKLDVLGPWSGVGAAHARTHARSTSCSPWYGRLEAKASSHGASPRASTDSTTALRRCEMTAMWHVDPLMRLRRQGRPRVCEWGRAYHPYNSVLNQATSSATNARQQAGNALWSSMTMPRPPIHATRSPRHERTRGAKGARPSAPHPGPVEAQAALPRGPTLPAAAFERPHHSLCFVRVAPIPPPHSSSPGAGNGSALGHPVSQYCRSAQTGRSALAG